MGLPVSVPTCRIVPCLVRERDGQDLLWPCSMLQFCWAMRSIRTRVCAGESSGHNEITSVGRAGCQQRTKPLFIATNSKQQKRGAMPVPAASTFPTLPLPGPATTRTTPRGAVTTAVCSALSFSKCRGAVLLSLCAAGGRCGAAAGPSCFASSPSERLRERPLAPPLLCLPPPLLPLLGWLLGAAAHVRKLPAGLRVQLEASRGCTARSQPEAEHDLSRSIGLCRTSRTAGARTKAAEGEEEARPRQVASDLGLRSSWSVGPVLLACGP